MELKFKLLLLGPAASVRENTPYRETSYCVLGSPVISRQPTLPFVNQVSARLLTHQAFPLFMVPHSSGYLRAPVPPPPEVDVGACQQSPLRSTNLSPKPFGKGMNRTDPANQLGRTVETRKSK